ncbi:metabotropic glutamate receptor 2 [Periplaneta americana]|uniref:metabotropic glutamate receptor 2 n=1 Tax=Periplaneta americana TaxID=6978 RepID=UPI0037E86027
MAWWPMVCLLLASGGHGSPPPPLRPRLELSTEFFLVPERGAPSNRSADAGLGAGTSRAVLRREVWVVPLLALAALAMLVIAGFEVFVLCKARRTTPSRRHLFLGQVLLGGLFLCAALGAVLAATPTPVTCAAVRFGAGVAYALVFAALLVKCVFLISLNGGVYLPAPYQALLLLFAVLIQVAVGAQWLLHSPPRVDLLPAPPQRPVLTAQDLVPLCHVPYSDVLCSLLYVKCLIALVAVLAVKSRGIRDNYREATFIGLAVGCSIPLWLVWVLSGLAVPPRHRDACLAFGLVSTATVVFLVMFMPKGRQLAAMGKEGVYVEDREEHFSSLSPAGSGYSPSFFHFKPVKCPPAPPPPVKQASAVTTLADRVALVAAPPSYTRMYHYYPYCYYPRYPGGVYVKPEDGNVYTTLEPTLSSNPNVFFQRGGVHPGMMY